MFIGRTKIAICVLLALAIGVWPEEEAFRPRSSQHRIPFQYHNGVIYIAAMVNKHHVNLLLDTGAGTTVFISKIAPPGRAGSVTTLNLAKGGMLALHAPVEFTLGEQSQKDRSCSFNREVIVGDFSFDGAEGVIGLDVLRSFKFVTIDFNSSVLILEDR